MYYYMRISICTPTNNRRKYIKKLIQYIYSQDYPLDDIEWLIFDDGTDKIEDLVIDIPFVKYFYMDNRQPIGFKRQFMNEQSTGDIIVNMDDDDIYPKERISHAVDMLVNNRDILIVGSSHVHIYYEDTQRVFTFGPYWANHATAATFAYKKELLKITKYEVLKTFAEERTFLKSYTIPLLQLDPFKTILVRGHQTNTVDKKKMLNSAKGELTREEIKKFNIEGITITDNEPIIL